MATDPQNPTPQNPPAPTANPANYFPAAAQPTGGGRGGVGAAPPQANADAYFPAGGTGGGATGAGKKELNNDAKPDYLEDVAGRAVSGVGQSLAATGNAFRDAAHFLRPADLDDPIEAHIDKYGGGAPGAVLLYRLGKALYSGAKDQVRGYRDALNQLAADVSQGKLREAGVEMQGGIILGPEGARRGRELAAGTREGGDLVTPVARDATDLMTLYLTEKMPQLLENAMEFKTATAREMAGGERASAAARALEGPINRSVGAAARDVTYGSPAQFLIDNEIPYISRGKQLQAVSKRLDNLTSQLRVKLGASNAHIDGFTLANNLITPAARALEKAAAPEEEIAAGKAELDLIWENVLKRNPTGVLTPAEANEVKQAIGDRVNFRARQELKVPDEVDRAFRKAYGAFKNAVNDAVPDAKELNENVSNGLALKHSLIEAVDRERAGQGGTTATGSMTLRGAAAAKAGRVAPGAVLAGQRVAAGAQAVRPAAQAAEAFEMTRGGGRSQQNADARKALQENNPE